MFSTHHVLKFIYCSTTPDLNPCLACYPYVSSSLNISTLTRSHVAARILYHAFLTVEGSHDSKAWSSSTDLGDQERIQSFEEQIRNEGITVI